MSAPPDGCTQNQSTSPRMSAQNHQEPPHADQPQQASNVRHIPIFVEGRDEPVINKSVDHGTHFGDTKQAYVPPQQPHPHPHADREQYYDDGPTFHAPPNFSRAFGTPFNKGFRQGPQPFVQQKVYPQTAFARGASPQRSQSPKPQSPPMHPEEHFVKVPVHHEQPRPQQKPAPPQQPAQQPPPPKQQTPPPQPKPQDKPAPSPNDPITLILSIQTDVLNLMSEVENFVGTKKDKKYLFLDEMLTRNLIKLDNIETDGKENIRQARKEAIKCIQKCIAVLEAKAEKGSSTPQPQDQEMQEGAAGAAAENGEVEMKEAPKEDNAEPLAEQQPSESQESGEAVAAAPADAAPAAEAQAADTRPADDKPSDTAVHDKDQEVEKKSSPKKGKNVKKRDKSKDKDSNKEQSEAKEEVQIDDKGDKSAQAMDVDGAASQ